MEEIYKDRAWIEIDMQNLQNNIEQIKKLISNMLLQKIQMQLKS